MNTIAEFFSDQGRLPTVHVEVDIELDECRIFLRDSAGAFNYELRMTAAEAVALEELLALAIARTRQFEHDKLKTAA